MRVSLHLCVLHCKKPSLDFSLESLGLSGCCICVAHALLSVCGLLGFFFLLFSFVVLFFFFPCGFPHLYRVFWWLFPLEGFPPFPIIGWVQFL